MLGIDLIQQLDKKHEVIGFDIDEVDVRKAEATAYVLREKPEFVFHLAAYTQVDRAEEEKEIAFGINVGGTQNVVNACKYLNAPLLFISTDYIFDGKKAAPYLETDDPHPINLYGNTKREAEKIVMDELDRWFIVRTSWLFGTHGKNFVTAIRRLAMEKDYLEVVDDQRGTPTYTKDLARALELFVDASSYGIYHITNKGNCTWFDFAREIIALTGSTAGVRPVASEKMKRQARRPANSVLDTKQFEEQFHYHMPTWQDALKRYLEEKAG